MSVKTTQREIRNTWGEDITYMSSDEIHAIRNKEKYFDELAWSAGVYGCNGLLLRGHETGAVYKITDRTQAIYCI